MGLPGADCLGALLERFDGTAYDTLCPRDTSGTWAASGGTLCPLVTGAALCDLAAELAGGREVTLGRTAWPVLLYPCVAAAADMTGAGLSLTWPGVALTRRDGVTCLSATETDILTTPAADSAHVGPCGDVAGDISRRAYRGDIPAHAASVLNRFAHRTYAPETEERRLAGAGAGLSDND